MEIMKGFVAWGLLEEAAAAAAAAALMVMLVMKDRYVASGMGL